MTLRDEIALAIGNIQREQWNLSPATKAEPIETWDGAFQAADAVLALLRKPTPEMVERAETRIWNDAIEAAAKIADQAFNMIEFAPGCDKMQDWDRDEIADAIRALRKE